MTRKKTERRPVYCKKIYLIQRKFYNKIKYEDHIY